MSNYLNGVLNISKIQNSPKYLHTSRKKWIDKVSPSQQKAAISYLFVDPPGPSEGDLGGWIIV
jgi:hypothetical protein